MNKHKLKNCWGYYKVNVKNYFMYNRSRTKATIASFLNSLGAVLVVVIATPLLIFLKLTAPIWCILLVIIKYKKIKGN